MRVSIVVLVLLLPFVAVAANTPCSGKKGGIDKCQGDTFICRDGSVSASKRSCTAYMGGALGGSARNMAPLMSAPHAAASGGESCACRSGSYCVGPRGGHYCYTDAGRKSYLRR